MVTVPVLRDLLFCHSRAWLPREESRSFPTSSSGIRDSSRAPDTHAGMTENSTERTSVSTILCRTQWSPASADFAVAAPACGAACVANSDAGGLHRMIATTPTSETTADNTNALL